MKEEGKNILRYWAAGMVFIIAAWIASAPILFFQGFFGFLTQEYGIISAGVIYSLLYIILVPYLLGRIIKWISHKILLS